MVKAKAKKAYYKVEQNQPSIDLFEQFIKECQAANIDLYMVYSPEYIEGQEFILNKGEVVEQFKKFSQQYNIPYLDYTKDSLCYDTKYFYNSMHMNSLGADEFTKKLMHDMKTQFPQLVKAN